MSKNGGSRNSFSEEEKISQRVALFAERELQFADACIAACRSDLLDDACRQQEYAAAYKLWVLWLVSRHPITCQVLEVVIEAILEVLFSSNLCCVMHVRRIFACYSLLYLMSLLFII